MLICKYIRVDNEIMKMLPVDKGIGWWRNNGIERRMIGLCMK